jgi:hypothetical protein
MSLVNMKMSSEERGEYGTDAAIKASEPSYPYGLSIDLDDGSMEKLGITALPKVGAEMMITAKCVVKSVSSNQYEGSDAESRMCLQITDMDVGQTENAQNDNRANKLYGNTNGTTEGRVINNLQSTMLGASN